jgi:hypothetical protein
MRNVDTKNIDPTQMTPPTTWMMRAAAIAKPIVEPPFVTGV